MANITMKELLEAGVHFGHQTKRWNPKMKEYIFGERNGIYIIDLQKTLKMFKDASKYVQDMAAQGKTIMFVGTKRQAQDAIAEEATRCGMFYVNQRWLGGLLTNWVTVQKSVKRLQELDDMATDGRYDLLPKKEVIKLERERKHLQANLAGIKSLKRLPDTVTTFCRSPREASAWAGGVLLKSSPIICTPMRSCRSRGSSSDPSPSPRSARGYRLPGPVTSSRGSRPRPPGPVRPWPRRAATAPRNGRSDRPG